MFKIQSVTFLVAVVVFFGGGEGSCHKVLPDKGGGHARKVRVAWGGLYKLSALPRVR